MKTALIIFARTATSVLCAIRCQRLANPLPMHLRHVSFPMGYLQHDPHLLSSEPARFTIPLTIPIIIFLVEGLFLGGWRQLLIPHLIGLLFCCV